VRFEFHPDALAEYTDAVQYYAERHPALGHRFIACVEEAIERIVDSPTTWPVVEQDVRRCLARIFPYAVLYTIEADRILIVAVMHCSRRPGYWKQRL
jgi:toxin ParE1/3/4